MPNQKNSKENPLANILINVLIPVVALSYLSKDPAFERSIGKTAHWWNLGPTNALMIALIPPIAYGIWFFIKTKKFNFFSALGLCSVLLTGILTLFLWNKDGTVKPHADILFGLKEASIPFVLGLAIIGSHWTRTPLLRQFLYTDAIFDIGKIENKIKEIDAQAPYQEILFKATLLFAASFFISTLLNFGLSMYFLGGLNHLAPDAREVYNAQVAKITGYGFPVILVPCGIFLFITLRKLQSGLRKITGFSDEEMMLL
ncbi:hypothetical protein JIN85_15975 [Luteolibacter pohnpeiensis]|uniref:MFS transporter n=1 Tax=Luteolibacter pohnpeiensis TaxID=454153 RepID=A0A934SD32_9BACT|nr:VC0807 family protein [Luteolibacter pohnpeiensis]MBK1883917.1 hypothetical protein [Luteolibacter pohnpeiensis]